MAALRRYIDANPAEMERLAKRVAKSEFHLEGEPYKRLKKDVGEVLNPWYNRKWISLCAEYDHGGALYTGELPQVLLDAYEKLMPVYRLLKRFPAEEQQCLPCVKGGGFCRRQKTEGLSFSRNYNPQSASLPAPFSQGGPSFTRKV